MLALIRKDFIAGRTILMIGSIVYLLFAVTAFTSDRGALQYFIVNIVATIALAVAPLLLDDKYDIDELVLLLPTSRRTIVQARYLMALLAVLGGLGFLYGCGWILSLGVEANGFAALCSPQALTVFCALPVVLVSLYLPCCYRFGLARGLFAFLVLMLSLSIILTGAAQAFGPIAGDGFAMTREMALHPESVLIAFVDYLARPLGNGMFYLTVVVGCVVSMIASLVLSMRYFEHREI